MAQHDRYENDILKQLKRIAGSLEKIEKNTKCPTCNITKISDDKYYIQSEGKIVDPKKSLYEQGLPSCLTCRHYTDCLDCYFLERDFEENPARKCCTDYEENE